MSLAFLKRLAIGLGILIVLWLGAEILRDNPGDGITEFELLQGATERIDSIVIGRFVDTVNLRRVGTNQWSVNGHRASGQAVSEFLDALGEGARAELVARNPESFSRFDIANETARRIRAFRGNTAALDVLVGKRGRDFQSVYVRRPGSDDVFVTRSQLGTFADRPLSDWRDKTIADVPSDAIGGFEVSRGGVTYTLVRADSGRWNIDGAPADSGAVARMAGQFASLTGTGFPTAAQLDSIDLENPDRKVIVRDSANNVLTELRFDSSATSGFWVRRVGDSTVLRLDRFRVDQLTPVDSTLRTGT